MQHGVEHPVRPLHVPSGQLPNSLEDGVAVAVPFGQDRQDDRSRGGGHQVLVDLHDLTVARRSCSRAAVAAVYLAALYMVALGIQTILSVSGFARATIGADGA